MCHWFSNIVLYIKIEQCIGTILEQMPVAIFKHKMTTSLKRVFLSAMTRALSLWRLMAFNRIFVFVLLKVKERYSPLLYESQQLSVLLEELEKQMTLFYDSLGKISEIITVLEHEAQSSALFKQKHQVRKRPFKETQLFLKHMQWN